MQIVRREDVVPRRSSRCCFQFDKQMEHRRGVDST